MKRSRKALLACSLACILLAQGPSPLQAASSTDANKVFNKTEVAKLVKKAKAQKITADKVGVSETATKFVATKKAAVSGTQTYAASSSYSTGSGSGSGTTVSGTYPTRKGTILVTKDAYKNLIPTGHAGIVLNQYTVIESLEEGVQYAPSDWRTRYKTCYGVTVNSTTAAQDAQVVDYIINQKWVGKPYNFNYFNVKTRSKFYCSQLVWAGFKDCLGIDLNTSTFGAAVHPMELVSTDKTRTLFSQE